MSKQYIVRNWPALNGLTGLSDSLLESHFALYQGYVKNTNALTEQLSASTKEGKAAGTNLAFAEMTRRLGFEYNGMILHEYYFDNLADGGSYRPPSEKLQHALAISFGSFEQFIAAFKAVATLRGVGWAVAFQDPMTRLISNHWIMLHNDGNPAGYKPILVMDAWEHAFIPDYKATERAKYIEAYLENVNWNVVEGRLL